MSKRRFSVEGRPRHECARDRANESRRSDGLDFGRVANNVEHDEHSGRNVVDDG